jgi:hypothetical protein
VPDFLNSPEEPMFAKMAAFEGRANVTRQVRARIVARHSLRRELRREPTRAELDLYAQRLYGRTDTALDVSGIPEAELREYYETDEELRALSGRVMPVRTPPTAGEGLTRDRIVRKVAELRRQDGTWPTQPVTAEALDLKDARRIRQVQGPRKWAGIVADAAALLAAGGG